MTKPNYYVEVQGEEVSCLGSQLKEILELIKLYPSIKNAIWYASDVLAVTIPPFIMNFEEFTPRKMGNTHDLIAICQHVDQFHAGVFLAFNKDVGDYLDEEFGTEDESFRDIGDAIFEIRAFDTTNLEIYAKDYDLIHKIAEKFEVKIFTEETIEHPRRYG
jgi:hypothetical protein